MVVYTRIHKYAKALSCVNYMLGLFFSQNHATVVHAMYADNVTMLSCSCSTYRRQLYVRPCCCTGMIYARGKALTGHWVTTITCTTLPTSIVWWETAPTFDAAITVALESTQVTDRLFWKIAYPRLAF